MPATKKKGIRIKDVRVGTGRVAEAGTFATIKYEGFLNRGEKILAGSTYQFKVGRRDNTAMLETPVAGMREGGVREARVGPQLAYRDAGVEGKIPPNAVIRWVIELIRVEDGETET